MSYLFMWVAGLAAVLLLLAAVVAYTSRWQRPLYRLSVPILVAICLMTPAVLITSGSAFLKYGGNLVTTWFGFTLSWTVLAFIGMILILRFGLRRVDEIPAARGWPVGRLALASTTMFVLLSVTFTYIDMIVRMHLATVRAETGAVVLALTPPRVPDRENAAVLYQQAFERIVNARATTGAKHDNDWDHDYAKIDFQDPQLRKYLARQQHALKLMHEASRLPGCSFDYNYFEGLALVLPGLQDARAGVRLLALRAAAEASKGDIAAAIDDINVIYRMSEHVSEPVLIAFLVSLAMESEGHRVLQFVLKQPDVQDRDLARIRLPMGTSSGQRLGRALQMEGASFGACFAGLDNDSAHLLQPLWRNDIPSPWATAMRSSFWRVFMLPSDLAGFQRMMVQMQRISRDPYYKSKSESEELRKDFEQNKPGIFTVLLLPAIFRVNESAARAEASHRLAEAGIACCRYRLKHGKYPACLDDLIPDYFGSIPVDPFDGKAIRLTKSGTGLRIYSVGLDGKDDGGVAIKSGDNAGDLVFEVGDTTPVLAPSGKATRELKSDE